MSGQCFIMNLNRIVAPKIGVENNETKPVPKEKVMSYEEKTVGSTPFFKCEACPYMALAEDDIKFHLFTVHPELAKTNGLADNIQIPCPGCTSVFDAEETLRNHLRNHHKMGIKDVRKMIRSLVQIALKNAKLKKEDSKTEPPPPVSQDIADVKIPQVIEIGPDVVNANSESLPKGVAFISVDELNKMSTPNFEQIDPKEIIQEASINIVYTNDVSTRFVNVSNTGTTSSCNVLKVSSVTPDLISSIQPRVTAVIDNSNLLQTQSKDNHIEKIPCNPPTRKGRPPGSKTHTYKNATEIDVEKDFYTKCSVGDCHLRMQNEEKLAYHRKCHQNGKLQCPECLKCFVSVEDIHTHLWKIHSVDMELPTCEICGFKTYKKYRLYNIHMKCHGNIKAYICPICSKAFKTGNQLTKHKLIHKVPLNPVQCSICQQQFKTEKRLKAHVSAVHEKLRPFKCCHCDYTAARKDEMKLHLRSHTGDKPYSCDVCQYRSADHNAMRRHKKLHTKETVYNCKHCPYSTIQSTTFTAHMFSNHPNVKTNDIHRCPYCPFKTVSKDKHMTHVSTHTDKSIQLLNKVPNSIQNKPSWTIPSETNANSNKDKIVNEQNNENSQTVNTIDVEEYDCDSTNESLPQDYSKTFTSTANSVQQPVYTSPVVQDLSKDDNNSDCLLSENSDDTLIERHQYNPQIPLQMTYDSNQSNLHGFLNTTVPMEQNLLQNNNVNSLAINHPPIGNNNISNNIMSNFPIRLPPVPQISVRNNITLTPVDKISIPLTTKVTGPIIKPTQILPVPSSSNSPVNIPLEPEGAPRKKPKISVKSNLILKGPDQVNMFHSQQKMAFKRLEDNERFGLGGPVTFNNLITTQFMQLQPEPALSESPNNIMTYPQETMLDDSATTPVDNGLNDNSQIFSFNQQINVNQMTMLPPPEKIITNDPSYIKLEATIKQNTQSPGLERMCNVNLLSNQGISREYKASPPLEDMNKNMNEIKNEVKSDAYYNMSLNNNATNPSIIDQYLIDNLIGEQYSAGHLDLSSVVLPEADQQDVIEIDDNSDDNKLLPRFDINFPMESLYLMHNDLHFLDNDIPNSIPGEVAVNEMNRMVAEVPIISQKETMEVICENLNNDFANSIQGKKDPMMNTSVRPTTNKINVKNIELMKN